jgi:mono/diheme cytochrome c family protein
MRRARTRALALLPLALALAGCRNDMHRQAKTKDLRESTFFADHSSARPLPEGVVARGFLREDAALYRGTGPDGKFVVDLPVPVTKQLLLRGQERFNIYCSPCHGRTGDGQGMIVQRGFKNPSTFHVDRLRNERAGYFFDVMTNGFGQMSSYAAQVPPEDRWAIVAWIRTLQASHSMPEDLLRKEDREMLDAAARAEATSATASVAHASSSPSSPSRKSSSSPSEAK